MQPLPDKNELQKLAASPAGQKLIAMLQSNKEIDMHRLSHSAAAGNYTDVIRQLSGFLASEDTKALLKQLEIPHE